MRLTEGRRVTYYVREKVRPWLSHFNRIRLDQCNPNLRSSGLALFPICFQPCRQLSAVEREKVVRPSQWWGQKLFRQLCLTLWGLLHAEHYPLSFQPGGR